MVNESGQNILVLAWILNPQTHEQEASSYSTVLRMSMILVATAGGQIITFGIKIYDEYDLSV